MILQFLVWGHSKRQKLIKIKKTTYTTQIGQLGSIKGLHHDRIHEVLTYSIEIL